MNNILDSFPDLPGPFTVNLEDVRDQTFSDGLSPSEHLNRLHDAGTRQSSLSLELATEIYNKITVILDGMDRVAYDDLGGWWETDDGAKFGKLKLRQLKDLLFRYAPQEKVK